MVDLSQAPAVLGRFSGGNPLGWVLQAEKYFQFYSISNDVKLPLISVYLDGDALVWFRWLYRNNQLENWENFVMKLFSRFSNDFMFQMYEISSRVLRQLDVVKETLAACSTKFTASQELSDVDSSLEDQHVSDFSVQVSSPIMDEATTMAVDDCVSDHSAKTEAHMFDEMPQSFCSKVFVDSQSNAIVPTSKMDFDLEDQVLDENPEGAMFSELCQIPPMQSLFLSHELVRPQPTPNNREVNVITYGDAASSIIDVSKVFNRYSQRPEDTMVEQDMIKLLRGMFDILVLPGIRLIHSNIFTQHPFDPGESIPPSTRVAAINFPEVLVQSTQLTEIQCIRHCVHEELYLVSHGRVICWVSSDSSNFNNSLVANMPGVYVLCSGDRMFVVLDDYDIRLDMTLAHQVFHELSARESVAETRLPNRKVVSHRHAFGLHFWVDTGQKEITLIPWDFGGHIDTQFGGMDPAISVKAKSGFPEASCKADYILAPRYLDESCGISFPFDPGARLQHNYFESSWLDSEQCVFGNILDWNLIVMLDIYSKQVVTFLFYTFSVMLQVLDLDTHNQLIAFELLVPFDSSYQYTLPWFQTTYKLIPYINQNDRVNICWIGIFPPSNFSPYAFVSTPTKENPLLLCASPLTYQLEICSNSVYKGTLTIVRRVDYDPGRQWFTHLSTLLWDFALDFGQHVLLFARALGPTDMEKWTLPFSNHDFLIGHPAISYDGFEHSLWSLLPIICNYNVATLKKFVNQEPIFSVLQDEELENCGLLCLCLLLLRVKRKVQQQEEFKVHTKCSAPMVAFVKLEGVHLVPYYVGILKVLLPFLSDELVLLVLHKLVKPRHTTYPFDPGKLNAPSNPTGAVSSASLFNLDWEYVLQELIVTIVFSTDWDGFLAWYHQKANVVLANMNMMLVLYDSPDVAMVLLTLRCGSAGFPYELSRSCPSLGMFNLGKTFGDTEYSCVARSSDFLWVVDIIVVTSMLIYSNLEDKVLIQDGGIVMDQPIRICITRMRQTIIGLERSNWTRRLLLRLIWDPGPIWRCFKRTKSFQE